MVFHKRNIKLVSLLLIFAFLLMPFAEAAELSIFDRLKLKVEEKQEQLQQTDWWITKAVSKAVGFVAGKAGGAIGAAAGYVIGVGLGGPVAAGMGAMIGFRIGDIVTKTFAKAVSELITQWKLGDQREVSVKTVFDAIKTVNKASLSAESVGAVLGDLVGGTMGAAAGMAMFAGTGPIVFPIIGAVSAAYIGSKLGKAIFGGFFRWAGRKLFKKGYEAYAASGSEDQIEEPASIQKKTVSDQPVNAVNDDSNMVHDSSPDNKNQLNIDQDKARSEYEQAYREYTRAVADSDKSQDEIQQKLQNYRAAFERYRASFSIQHQN